MIGIPQPHAAQQHDHAQKQLRRDERQQCEHATHTGANPQACRNHIGHVRNRQHVGGQCTSQPGDPDPFERQQFGTSYRVNDIKALVSDEMFSEQRDIHINSMGADNVEQKNQKKPDEELMGRGSAWHSTCVKKHIGTGGVHHARKQDEPAQPEELRLDLHPGQNRGVRRGD